jgi:hydroxypyruvate isomerase
MAKFAANLTMLFTEVDFLERFEKAHSAGFKAVEYLFPYAFEAEALAEKMQMFGFEQALFNMPPGDWDAGERGFAAIPGREEEFKQSVDAALLYAEVLNCRKVHAMPGLIDTNYTREQQTVTFISNIRYAADKFAEHGIQLMIEPLNSRDVPHYFVAHQREAPERHEPSEGELNYPHLFTVLDECGYQDWIGCEYNPRNTTEEGLGWVKPYL